MRHSLITSLLIGLLLMPVQASALEPRELKGKWKGPGGKTYEIVVNGTQVIVHVPRDSGGERLYVGEFNPKVMPLQFVPKTLDEVASTDIPIEVRQQLLNQGYRYRANLQVVSRQKLNLDLLYDNVVYSRDTKQLKEIGVDDGGYDSRALIHEGTYSIGTVQVDDKPIRLRIEGLVAQIEQQKKPVQTLKIPGLEADMKSLDPELDKLYRRREQYQNEEMAGNSALEILGKKLQAAYKVSLASPETTALENQFRTKQADLKLLHAHVEKLREEEDAMDQRMLNLRIEIENQKEIVKDLDRRINALRRLPLITAVTVTAGNERRFDAQITPDESVLQNYANSIAYIDQETASTTAQLPEVNALVQDANSTRWPLVMQLKEKSILLNDAGNELAELIWSNAKKRGVLEWSTNSLDVIKSAGEGGPWKAFVELGQKISEQIQSDDPAIKTYDESALRDKLYEDVPMPPTSPYFDFTKGQAMKVPFSTLKDQLFFALDRTKLTDAAAQAASDLIESRRFSPSTLGTALSSGRNNVKTLQYAKAQFNQASQKLQQSISGNSLANYAHGQAVGNGIDAIKTLLNAHWDNQEAEAWERYFKLDIDVNMLVKQLRWSENLYWNTVDAKNQLLAHIDALKSLRQQLEKQRAEYTSQIQGSVGFYVKKNDPFSDIDTPMELMVTVLGNSMNEDAFLKVGSEEVHGGSFGWSQATPAQPQDLRRPALEKKIYTFGFNPQKFPELQSEGALPLTLRQL